MEKELKALSFGEKECSFSFRLWRGLFYVMNLREKMEADVEKRVKGEDSDLKNGNRFPPTV